MLETVELLLRCSNCFYKKKFALTQDRRQRLAQNGRLQLHCTYCEGPRYWELVKDVEAAQTVAPTATEAKRILVVDDDDLTVKLLTKVLEAWETQVEIAQNGREALAKLAAENFDLMVCDIQMPEMTGPELFQQIQEKSYLPPQRILFLTGDKSPATKQFLDSSGCYYLYKPLQFMDFCDQVQEVLAGKPPT
jgi:CheY-like chemotaxis protein